MNNHYKFVPGEQSEFLFNVQSHSQLSVNELADMVKISPRNFRDWKNDKFNISTSAANFFSEKFNVLLPESENILVSRWKLLKKNKAKIGGFAFKAKYGSPGTKEGRIKGGTKALAILRMRGIIPEAKTYKLPYGFSIDLAEFVGILLGDGCITSLQTTITLDSHTDLQFAQYISQLGKSLFGETPKMYHRSSCNVNIICYHGKQLVEYLTRIGLKTGNKVIQQVGVPDWILCNSDFKIACLKGLIDTDGGIHEHKYKVGGKLYAYNKLHFTNQSVPLINFVFDTLNSLNLNPKKMIRIENKKVWLYNRENVQKYLGLVGSSNERLLKFRRMTQTATRTVR